jgi:hypothetical protein
MVFASNILIHILVYLVFVNPFIQHFRLNFFYLKRFIFYCQNNLTDYSIDFKKELLRKTTPNLYK